MTFFYLVSSLLIHINHNLTLFIFFRVCRYIDEYDLKRFLIKEEVDIVLPMIDVAETGQIDKKALTEWVVCSELNHFFGLCLAN